MAYNAFAEWTKMFGEFKAPSLDMKHVIAQGRRNAEAGSAVTQIVIEGVRENARRMAEVVRSNAEQALRASKEIVGNRTSESNSSKKADFAKNWIEYNVNSMREMVEVGTKSAQEVFEVVNKHISEQVKEFSEAATSRAYAANKKKAA